MLQPFDIQVFKKLDVLNDYFCLIYGIGDPLRIVRKTLNNINDKGGDYYDEVYDTSTRLRDLPVW